MSAELVVHVTQRAAPAQAAWLVQLLRPVAAACRFSVTPPLEIRPTGDWGGWCARKDHALDGRVAVSSKFVFWSKESVVDVVLHEWTHRVLQDLKIFDHPAEFFCLNAVFLIRASEFFDGDLDPLLRLSLYDMQDQPEDLAEELNWRGLIIDWALPVAAELASTDAAAEDLAKVVCERWNKFAVDRQASIQLAQTVAVNAAREANRHAVQLRSVLESRSLWRAMALIGWLSFLVFAWLVTEGFK